VKESFRKKLALTEHNTLLLPTERMMNGNLEVTDKGEFVSVSKNNLIFDQGQRVIKTKDGSETANYTLIEVSYGTVFPGGISI